MDDVNDLKRRLIEARLEDKRKQWRAHGLHQINLTPREFHRLKDAIERDERLLLELKISRAISASRTSASTLER